MKEAGGGSAANLVEMYGGSRCKFYFPFLLVRMEEPIGLKDDPSDWQDAKGIAEAMNKADDRAAKSGSSKK